MKKAVILGVSSMLTLGFFSPSLGSVAEASGSQKEVITETKATSNPGTEEASVSVSEVAPYVHKNDQGHLYVDQDIPMDVYVQNEVSSLEKSFEEINKQVDSGQLVVNEDLSITNKLDDAIFAKAASKGYTSKTYWWGERATYTNYQTKVAVKQLRDAAIDTAFNSVYAVIIPPVAAVTSLTAAYLNKVAKSMENANRGNGVILDMTWALAYSVKSR